MNASRAAGLLLWLCGAHAVAAALTHAPAIDFIASRPAHAPAADEYRRIWAQDGARIAAAFERLTSLTLEPGPIRTIVYDGISRSGYPGWPMRMRADLSPATQRATLVHELAHRLVADLVPRGFDDHPVIFLFVYDVWVELWGKAFADAQIVVESHRRGRYDYEGAWRHALALGARGRAQRWAEFLAERAG